MSANSHKTTYLKDYQAPRFEVDYLNLYFDLHETHTIVKSEMHLTRNTASTHEDKSLILAGEALRLVSLELNDKALEQHEYEVTASELIIPNVPESFTLKIETEIKPHENTTLSGLYKSKTNFCTQCEAHGFRRITYYLDRPDVLTRFTTTICADRNKYPNLLSNGNPIERGEDGERHWVKWEDPFKKPSYLFALVAGDLECLEDKFITCTGREIKLDIYVEKGKSQRATHAMHALKQSMKWDEEYYGREYDLDIFMIVAVSDFNMGAMENKGLNIFNDQYILASLETATDTDYQNISGVVAHEYFHNWTGNRITCRDWFQLSLKEGLTVFRDQEFSRTIFSADVMRIQDVKVLRTHQFSEDAGPMAHPVRPQSYIEINNFYTATVYNKGAEVIRMQHTILGAAGFRKGMDLYFDRHDGEAVTTDDFVQCMMDANDVDLTHFKNWYNYAGTPELDVKFDYNENKKLFTLQLKQSCPDTPGQTNKPPFDFPFVIGLLDKAGKELPLLNSNNEKIDPTLRINESEQSFHFHHLEEKPVLSLLRGFSAPIKVNIDYSEKDLAHLLTYDTDGFSRFEAGQQLLSKSILSLTKKVQLNEALLINPLIVDTIKHLLDHRPDDHALSAELLSIPTLGYLKEQMDSIDIQSLHRARLFVLESIAKTCEKEFFSLYQELAASTEVEGNDAMANRHFKNTLLAFLARTGKNEYLSIAYEQFSTASTMTDQIAALACLNHHDCVERQQALDKFFERWQDDALVLNKWFAIQAQSELPNTLENVKKLLTHRSFDIKNPNKVRALVGTFCMANLLHFHDESGAGYEFLREQVLILDPLNPQVSARMITPLLSWKQYNPNAQKLMCQELEILQKEKNLSSDLYEKVEKGLVCKTK